MFINLLIKFINSKCLCIFTMDHVLKELLEEIKEQGDDILDEIDAIKEKLGIVSSSDDEDDEEYSDEKAGLDKNDF